MTSFLRTGLICLFILSFLVLPPRVFADSLVNIDQKGNISVNVLAAENAIELAIPTTDSLAVKEVGEEAVEGDSRVSLHRDGQNINLLVVTESGERSLDVTEIDQGLIQVEERPAVNSFTISANNDSFVLEQEGVRARTSYDIKIDPISARITLTTPSGFKYLAIFPKEAVETVLRSKIVTNVSADSEILIIEEGAEGLTYQIQGEKVINFFNIYKYPVGVTTRVSASTAEVLFIDAPPWLRFIDFLFA